LEYGSPDPLLQDATRHRTTEVSNKQETKREVIQQARIDDDESYI
jgi:hypothetical protein